MELKRGRSEREDVGGGDDDDDNDDDDDKRQVDLNNYNRNSNPAIF